MRILLSFILFFMISSAFAQETKPLLLGHEKKPLLGYEKPPAPKKTTPYPEITYYYGPIRESLQALQLRSARQLTRTLMRNGFDRKPFEDKALRGYRKHVLRNYLMALPRIQLLLHVRDQLPGILAMHGDHRGDFHNLGQYLIKEISRSEAGSFSDYNIFFDYDSKGEFQVDGIDVNRLAVNTGYHIHFNLNGLIKLESFTVADAVQLWLHEMLHNVPSVPLETRDAYSAEVANWVKQYVNEFEISKDRKVVAVVLPAKIRKQADEQVNDNIENYYRKSIQQRFFMLDQGKTETKLISKVYDGFATFGNEVRKPIPQFYSSTKIDYWPEISVSGVRKVGPKSFRVEYEQSHLYYDHRQHVLSRNGDGYGIGFKGTETPPRSNFRIDLNLENSNLEINRNYSRALGPDDFEIYRIEDVGDKRFVSVRVRTQNINNLLNARQLHVLGKNNADGEPLSFEVAKVKALNQEEALIHVQVPRRSMVLGQILVPVVSKNGEYQESLIRSSQPASLVGPMENAEKIEQVKSVAVETRIVDSDKLKVKMVSMSSKPIKGITLDLEHSAATYKYELNNWQEMSGTAVGFTHMGRKYYLQKNEIRQEQDGKIEFVVPLATIMKTVDGPRMERKVSRWYTETWQEKGLPYVVDNSERRLINLWIHYEDGTVAKVDPSLLPQDRFSMRSEEDLEREMNARYEAAKAYFDQFDHGDSAPAPQTCEGLF